MSYARIVISACLLLVAGAAAADPSTLEQALSQRRARAIEQSAPSRDVQGDIARERRNLLRDQGRLSTRDEAIQRQQLDNLPEGPRPEPNPPRPVLPPDLNRTYGPDDEGLPTSLQSPDELPSRRTTAPGGSDDVVTIANRLMERSRQAAQRGQSSQARSDLDTAARILDGLPVPPKGHAAEPRLATARQRLNLLREQQQGATVR